MKKSKKNLEVLLTGKRKQYLINNLKKENIKFHYFEMVDFSTLNNLYNTLDLYIISSRVEGGPRALLNVLSQKLQLFQQMLVLLQIFYLKNPYLKVRTLEVLIQMLIFREILLVNMKYLKVLKIL